ncbi:sugar-binding transcriptional regulator [Thermotoga profunda]|uniref:sugar-binding transcriptional regulator n=1 Tax=Thermotoga profunda TaxID=1508420 RepID=UPI000596E916|nr:sugar-binding transcriptional regulator [Thermotoga profunda]
MLGFQNYEDLLTIVAWMYYMDEYTQQQIAEELGITRTKVSRLLSAAKSQGIVQIRITHSLPEYYVLEKELKRRFGLKIAVVAPEDRNLLGQFGAESLLRFISEHRPCRVGLGWSTTVSSMAPHLIRRNIQLSHKCSVYDLTGSFIGQRNPYSISWILAEATGAQYIPLAVPVLVENPSIKEEPSIKRALKEASEVDIAFVGMGCVGQESTLLKTRLVSKETMEQLEKLNCVGEVLMRFFDENGKPVRTPLDDRIVSIDWDAIQRIPIFVVMAVGKEKVSPLKAALKGGWVSGLITDVYTAKSLLGKAQ